MYIPTTVVSSSLDWSLLLAGLGSSECVGTVEDYGRWDLVLCSIETVLAHIWIVLQKIHEDFLHFLREVARDPNAWAAQVLTDVYSFLHDHPHIVSISALALFVGPIIILLPFIVLQEISVLLTFNLGFITHGLIPGRVEDKYETLKSQYVESREKVFASVEAANDTFNDWTTNHRILMITRVLAGLLGAYMLYELWGKVLLAL